MPNEQNFDMNDVSGQNVNVGGTQNIYYSGSPPGGQSPTRPVASLACLSPTRGRMARNLPRTCASASKRRG